MLVLRGEVRWALGKWGVAWVSKRWWRC